MNTYTTALLLFSSLLSITALGVDITSFHPSKLLTYEDFSNILFRAVNDDYDVTLQHLHPRQRKLRGHSKKQAWNEIIQHGWTATKSNHRNLRSENSTYRAPIQEITLENHHPFLLCSSHPNLSGYLRLQRILSTFNTSTSNAQTVYNSEETSCFVIVTTSDAIERAFGESYLETGETRDSRMAHIMFAPLSDVLKFAAGTPSSIIYDENWVLPDDTKPNLRKGSTNSSEEKQHWTRSFLVDLIPGSVADPNSGDEGIVSISQEILSYVSAMANIKPMPAKQYNSTKLSILRNNDIDSLSVRELFSLTSDRNNMKARSAHNIWSEALQNGFESEHGCGNMFDSLEIRPRGNLEANTSDNYEELVSVIGFELILHAPKSTDASSVESSAWNKQCVLSLIIGLSIQPMVQTIEIAQKLELASITGKTNPQWITQSGKVNRRPFFDSGLDGSGQVVAVADGGLDRDNCYFNDANAAQANIFGGSWDMTQRKVVNYDDTFADQKEIAMGHGTYVSGIIAGKKSTNGIDDENGNADGVAPGSKLSFFDMEVGQEGIQDPGVQRLFKSFYNLGKGAKIMNGSWGRSYGGVYTSYCRDYDSLLRSKYADVLFVVSAGNTGFGAIESSIQNPADCKNAFAVGASLSYGRDIRSKEKGIEYLADYSSRGPSADGRIKPDIVAPGHFILAPNADPSRFGECDGTSLPNVMYSLKAGQGGRYVSGTSMSAPVVAGSAAIVRQYFEEGWCNERCCGSKGCGVPIDPSGSLVKAILMNGAQPLEGGVQVVPDGSVLQDEHVAEYDNNQGYGRLNLNYSLPLAGENNFQLHAINDKKIQNDAKHRYLVDIVSDGCNSDLRVTLAWYDAPGSVGCTTCLMNDLDVYIEQVNGGETFYPNGNSRRDWKNTVERIRIVQPRDGKYRVIVHAKNLATQNQRYSLAISGCLKSDEPTSSPSASPQQIQTISPSAAPQQIQTLSTTGEPHIQNQDVPKPLGSTKSSHCPDSELFELELVAVGGENKMTWDLIMPTKNASSEVVLSSIKAPKYQENTTYYYTACLKPNRYRFKMLHVGDASFSIFVGGQEVLSSKSLSHPQNLYSFRFRVTASGYAPITSKRSRTK